MKQLSISQSLIKDWRDYEKRDFCGLLFDALWISRTHRIEPTPAMLLGQWFEYLALGPWKQGMGQHFMEGMKAAGKKSVDQWDEILQDPWGESDPGTVAELKAKPADVEAHFLVKFVNLYYQAAHLRTTFKAYGIEPIKIQEKVITDMGKIWRRTMVWDVYAQVNAMPDPNEPSETLPPHKAIIDTKATGLIDDRWKPYGWDVDTLIYRDKILVQPIDYLDQVRMHEDLEVDAFYFFVHSNTNDTSRKIVQITTTTGILDAHRKEVQRIVETIDFERFKGWKPYPDLDRCNECPLKDDCAHRAKHPSVRVVNLI